MANHGHDVTMPARLDAHDAKTVRGVVVGYSVDEASQYLAVGWFGLDLHETRLLAPARESAAPRHRPSCLSRRKRWSARTARRPGTANITPQPTRPVNLLVAGVQRPLPNTGTAWTRAVLKPVLMSRNSLDSSAKPGGIHAHRYHWRGIGWRDARASLAESWRGRDLGSTQSRRSETCGATQGARQSASRSGQGGGGRGDRDALVRGRGCDQEPGQPRR